MDTAHNKAVVALGGAVRHPRADLARRAFLGYETPAGSAVRDVAFAYRLVDGRIAERWAIRDDLTMLRQLGALHP
jgi:hypothetical protein